MSLKKIIKTFAITTLLTLSAAPVMGQDLLARQAPVDRKMKTVDTLMLRNITAREEMENPAAELYEDWNNTFAHRATALPETYRINLKHFCMPTPSRVVTSNFGARWGRQHEGLDIKVYIGDTIRAAFSGKVRMANMWSFATITDLKQPTDTCQRSWLKKTRRCVPENPLVLAATPVEALAHTCILRHASAAWP